MSPTRNEDDPDEKDGGSCAPAGPSLNLSIAHSCSYHATLPSAKVCWQELHDEDLHGCELSESRPRRIGPYRPSPPPTPRQEGSFSPIPGAACFRRFVTALLESAGRRVLGPLRPCL